jgi:hypothetical protein
MNKVICSDEISKGGKLQSRQNTMIGKFVRI